MPSRASVAITTMPRRRNSQTRVPWHSCAGHLVRSSISATWSAAGTPGPCRRPAATGCRVCPGSQIMLASHEVRPYMQRPGGRGCRGRHRKRDGEEDRAGGETGEQERPVDRPGGAGEVAEGGRRCRTGTWAHARPMAGRGAQLGAPAPWQRAGRGHGTVGNGGRAAAGAPGGGGVPKGRRVYRLVCCRGRPPELARAGAKPPATVAERTGRDQTVPPG